MPFTLPEKVPLARLPTPLQRLPRLSQEWGVELWVKRDDLTGAELSGNKVRKLEFSFAEARRRGAASVITCGGVQSNHCRATAIAARRLGLHPHLLLRTKDGKPEPPDGNLLLDRLVGAEISWVTPGEYREERAKRMAEIAARLEKEKGGPCLVIPEGASDATGALGYLAMVEELREQVRRQESPALDYLVHACGSGGTSAGLAIGNELFRAAMFPVAFAVCDDEAYFREVVGVIVVRFSKQHRLNLADVKLAIVDRYKGAGYGINSREELAFLREVAEKEGLFLDPVYGVKAFLGMKRELERGTTFRKGSTLCFVHTGGIFGLFPKREELAAVL